MKLFNCVIIIPLLLAVPCAADTPVTTSITYDPANPTNKILLTWEAIPGKQYNILTTTALGQPWQPLTAAPVPAERNLVKFSTLADRVARFYTVAKLDTEPPEVWRLSPRDGAIAVGRQSPLNAFLRDETGIDPASIVFSIGTNPPVTLADPRLSYTNGVLAYTPATNEFLGTNAQTVSASLAISDTLGHRGTNSWSFQLELATILASNVVLVGSSAGLTLVSTNGSNFVFSYTGSSSGLTNGQVLVSTDTNSPYKRKVISLADNPASHTVSVATKQASLAQCIQQGSIRLLGVSAEQNPTVPFPGPVPAPPPLEASISLDGIVIYDNGTIRAEVTSGRITFAPKVTVAADFQELRLTSFDFEVSATMGLDMTLQASAQAIGDFAGSRPVPGSMPIRTRILVGFIPLPPPVPPIPVYGKAVLEFNIGYEAHLEAIGTATWGFQSSRTLMFGATLRNGQWTYYSPPLASTFTSFPPSWEINGSARLRGYLEPKLTIYLESLAGPSADLKPYLELDGNACVQPGQAGVDLSLYAGLSSTLAIDVRGWDAAWVALPSWEIFNLRGLIWHKNLATPLGSPPQTFGNMVRIPCGTFTMGSPDSEPVRGSNEGPQTRVTITHGFWMGKYEVTQGEYSSVIGNNPSAFQGDLNCPVEQVNWNDAVAYCASLTTRERNAGRLPAGYVYRLPTEAEWEYACRAGTTTAFHYGPALRSGMANFCGLLEYPPCGGNFSVCYNPSGTCLVRTTTVGSYAPNAWGLYDMHGNVWEWCQDWYAGSLPGGSVPDPKGPNTGSYRVWRGGSWIGLAGFCRSAFRDGYLPGYRGSGFGFRVVLAPGQP